MNSMNQALSAYRSDLEALSCTPASVLTDGKTALVIVDMINGFLTEGILSSPRSASILPAVENLLRFAKENSIPTAAFADCHEKDSIEFQAFPPHCLKGTSESEIAPSLCGIGGFTRIEKNSTNGFLTEGFQEFLAAHPECERFVVCGVCTDICVMQFALSLKCFGNQCNRALEVIVPVNAVETYDAPAHNADLMQTMALQMLANAGITLTGEVQYHD